MESQEEMWQLEKDLNLLEYKRQIGHNLSFSEEAKLGLAHLMALKDIHLLDDDFNNYKFRELIFRYGHNPTFTGTYYRQCLEKSILNYIDLDEIKKVNYGEFDEEGANLINQKLIDCGFKVLLSEKEVEKDKSFLFNTAISWGKQMVIGNHKNKYLNLVSKETRDTLSKVKIEDFIEGKLNPNDEFDVFLGLTKSKFVFIEAMKQIESFPELKDEITYSFGIEEVFLNFESVIHILNRHYIEQISTEQQFQSKTFHTVQTDPFDFNKTFYTLFELLDQNFRLFKEQTKSFYLEKNKEKYSLYTGRSKSDPNKTIIKTYFLVDESSQKSLTELEKFKKKTKHSIGDEWFVYI